MGTIIDKKDKKIIIDALKRVLETKCELTAKRAKTDGTEWQVEPEPDGIEAVLEKWFRDELSSPHVIGDLSDYKVIEGENIKHIMPLLDSPDLDLFNHEIYKANTIFVKNSYQLMVDCLTMAISCYKNKKNLPDDDTVIILIRLSSKIARYKVWSLYIADFIFDSILSPASDQFSIPTETVRQFALGQLLSMYPLLPEVYMASLLYPSKSSKKIISDGLKWMGSISKARKVAKDFREMRAIQKEAREKVKEINKPVISFHSIKGGTGKTTLACSYAAACVESGENVALIDCDLLNPAVLDLGLFPHLKQNEIKFPLERILWEGLTDDAKSSDNSGGVFFLRFDRKETADEPHGLYLVVARGGLATPDRPNKKWRDYVDETLIDDSLWEMMRDNFTDLIEFLILPKNEGGCGCDRVIIDNHPGMWGFSHSVCSMISGWRQHLVFVVTLDTSDLGSLPESIGAFYRALSDAGSITIVFSKTHYDEIRKQLFDETSGELILPKTIQASFIEGCDRAGISIRDFPGIPQDETIAGDEKGISLYVPQILMQKDIWRAIEAKHSDHIKALWYLKSVRRNESERSIIEKLSNSFDEYLDNQERRKLIDESEKALMKDVFKKAFKEMQKLEMKIKNVTPEKSEGESTALEILLNNSELKSFYKKLMAIYDELGDPEPKTGVIFHDF